MSHQSLAELEREDQAADLEVAERAIRRVEAARQRQIFLDSLFAFTDPLVCALGDAADCLHAGRPFDKARLKPIVAGLRVALNAIKSDGGDKLAIDREAFLDRYAHDMDRETAGRKFNIARLGLERAIEGKEPLGKLVKRFWFTQQGATVQGLYFEALLKIVFNELPQPSSQHRGTDDAAADTFANRFGLTLDRGRRRVSRNGINAMFHTKRIPWGIFAALCDKTEDWPTIDVCSEFDPLLPKTCVYAHTNTINGIIAKLGVKMKNTERAGYRIMEIGTSGA